MWSGYFYIENLALTAAQREPLIDTLKGWGLSNSHPNPRHRNHWRVRTDGQAVIFEADFDESNLTALWFRTRLASILSVPVANVTSSTTQTAYGPLLTFKYNTTDRLRLGLFGGLSASYAESQAAAQKFLADNQAAWETILGVLPAQATGKISSTPKKSKSK